ncbi:MAG TPA: IclR family transcriptional regulator [Solirubrobacteraceae bacterium]|jgi:DNA-binding IclR family transcriptional regulator
MSRGGDGSTPQLLERAFALLALFDAEHSDWTTTEAARAIGLPVPTAHRILGVLEREGFLARNEDKRFTLGHQALRLGQRAIAVLSVERLATPLLERLAALTDEVALLTEVNDGGDGVVCRLRFESSQPLRLSVAPGRELPLYAGASQKALLAFLPNDTVDAVCRGQLTAVCRATITRPERLREHLREVRRRGWAISFEETDKDVWGIALPIVDDRGVAVAAVGLAGPRNRLDASQVRHQLTALHEAAMTVAARMGYNVPRLDLAPIMRRPKLSSPA